MHCIVDKEANKIFINLMKPCFVLTFYIHLTVLHAPGVKSSCVEILIELNPLCKLDILNVLEVQYRNNRADNIFKLQRSFNLKVPNDLHNVRFQGV